MRAAAQRVVPSLEVGAATMRFGDSVAASTASLTPGLTIDWNHVRLTALGTYTQLGSTGWSTQGSAGLSAVTPTLRTFSGELAASSGGSAHWDGTRSAQSIALFRGHVDASDAGAWAGGGTGDAWDGVANRLMLLGDAGAWARVGSTTFALTITPVHLGDTLRYTDSELSARWQSASLEISAAGGFRAGDRLTLGGASGRSWASTSIVAHVTPYAGIVFAAGTYPVDLGQGFPGGRYVMLNLRFSPPTRFVPRSIRGLIEIAQRTAALPVTSFELAAMPNGESRVLRVRAPDTRSVEITGDFSSWRPMTLSSSGDGWWVGVLPLAPGTHQVMIRVNGGSWTVPPGLLPVTDEFGGVAGLWIVK
jgi:hypothetical protein